MGFGRGGGRGAAAPGQSQPRRHSSQDGRVGSSLTEAHGQQYHTGHGDGNWSSAAPPQQPGARGRGFGGRSSRGGRGPRGRFIGRGRGRSQGADHVAPQQSAAPFRPVQQQPQQQRQHGQACFVTGYHEQSPSYDNDGYQYYDAGDYGEYDDSGGGFYEDS
ncbi:unnamed protein product [Pylaiella littoralis]